MLNDLHGQALALMNRLYHTAPSSQSSLRARSMRERIRSRCRLGEEGSNLVEFALIIPVLMGLLTGIFSFGLAMLNYESLTHGTAAAAQYLAVARGAVTDPCADAFTKLSGAASSLNKPDITVSVQFGANQAVSQKGPTATCQGSKSQMVAGSTVTVGGSYPCNIKVYGITVASTCNLTASLSEYEN